MLEAFLVPALLLMAMGLGLFTSAWFYRVSGKDVRFAGGTITTPLGRFSYDKNAGVVRAETDRGRSEFAVRQPVGIQSVPHSERAMLAELLLGDFGITDLFPAFHDTRLTLVVGLRSEGRFLPLASVSQHRDSDVLYGSDPPRLSLLRALRLYRDVNDVATELRATFIEAFRELGLKVQFFESI